MTKRLLIRLICVVIFASSAGYLIERDTWHKHQLGREGFLTQQDLYWNQHLAGMPAPPAKFLEYTIIMGCFFAAYEGLALGLSLLLGQKRLQDTSGER